MKRFRNLALFLVCILALGAGILHGIQPAIKSGTRTEVTEKRISEKKRKNKKKKESAVSTEDQSTSASEGTSSVQVEEDGTYISKDEVAAYIHEFGHLPSNFITKQEAQDLGWDSYAGNLDEVAPGMSIGGNKFGNYEGYLPEAYGRKYYECDIDYTGGRRNAKRIIYSNDGLVYYTEDHYNTFEHLYGEE